MTRLWHIIKPFIFGIAIVACLLALILVPAVITKGDVSQSFQPLQEAAQETTASEQMTVGPLPGDLSKYASEQKCQQGLSTPGYLSAMNAAEMTDAQRSGVYTCADFLGSRTEDNVVYTYKAEGSYPQVQYVNNDGPNGMFVVGGTSPPSTGLMTPGPYVARINPISGEQVWRTYLENGNVNERLHGRDATSTSCPTETSSSRGTTRSPCSTEPGRDSQGQRASQPWSRSRSRSMQLQGG